MIPRVVAIDGPGGSGKSTVSRAVAARIGWGHLDTGGYYRATALVALREGADLDDQSAVLAAIEGRRFAKHDSAMTLDGCDISGQIRTAAVTAASSRVAVHPELRRRMVSLQQEWVSAHPSGAVVEGRDIGTVVFPNAPVKVFLTADRAERARRRALEAGADQAGIAGALEQRDRLDAARTVSPLHPAPDAQVIDTTGLGIGQVVEAIVELARIAGLVPGG